jgi:hypothetical protein
MELRQIASVQQESKITKGLVTIATVMETTNKLLQRLRLGAVLAEMEQALEHVQNAIILSRKNGN